MAKILTMTLDSLKDILHKQTGNPIAEEEIPQLVKGILKSGGKVECTLDDLIIPVVLSEDDKILFDIAYFKKS